MGKQIECLSAPKSMIQGTNLGNFCKLSFEVIKKIKASENTYSKYPITICSGRKGKSSMTHSLPVGVRNMWGHSIPDEYWSLLQHSV